MPVILDSLPVMMLDCFISKFVELEFIGINLPFVDSFRVVEEAESMLAKDIQCNKSIGEHGAQHIRQNCQARKHCLMTHCNTGSLATAGYGTALGMVTLETGCVVSHD